MSDDSSVLRIVWIYPDLLSTYGDQGNALILRRRAEQRGIRTEIVYVYSSDPVPVEGDIYLLGGGEDRPQTLAAERLRSDGGLKRAAESGAAVLAVCAGYQIVGESFGDDDDNPLPGVGILDIRSGRGETRAVGEIVADVAPSWAAAGSPVSRTTRAGRPSARAPRHCRGPSKGSATTARPRAPTRAPSWGPTCTAPHCRATPPSPTCC